MKGPGDDELSLYTTMVIPKGGIICQFTGDTVSDPDEEYGNPYSIQVVKRPPTYIDARKTNEEEGRWAREGRQNNSVIWFNPETGKACLVALRDIAASEEITCTHEKIKTSTKAPKIASKPNPAPKLKRLKGRLSTLPEEPTYEVEPDAAPYVYEPSDADADQGNMFDYDDMPAAPPAPAARPLARPASAAVRPPSVPGAAAAAKAPARPASASWRSAPGEALTKQDRNDRKIERMFLRTLILLQMIYRTDIQEKFNLDLTQKERTINIPKKGRKPTDVWHKQLQKLEREEVKRWSGYMKRPVEFVRKQLSKMEEKLKSQGKLLVKEIEAYYE
jgi:hypothetical protein